VAAPLSRRFGLLQRAPAFRLLFLATLGSGIGTWLAAIALTVDVFNRTHSGSWVSALLIADFLPMIVVGLLLGSLLDRLPRQKLMVAADLVRFGVFCYLPFAHSAAAIVAAAGVVGLANGFFGPAVWAGMPNLVEDAELPYANSLFQTTENLSWAVGPLLGGALVAASGPHLAYWVNAVTFVLSASLVARIPPRALQVAQVLTKGHLSDLADGFRAVARARARFTVLVVWTVAMLGTSAVNVTEVVLAKVTFNSGAFGFGVLAAASGVGLVAGSALVARELDRRGVAVVYAFSIALMAIGTGAAAASPDVWVAAVCVVVSGVGNGAAVVCNGLLVQRGAPDALRGRVFTLIMSVNGVARALAMVGAGVLVDRVGARWLWGGGALSFVAAGLLAAALVPRRSATAVPARSTSAPL
jgi:MFS family permease